MNPKGPIEDLPPFQASQLQALFEQGISLAEASNITPQALEDKYRIAYDHCQAGEFDLALPHFVQLVTLQPYDRRFHLGLGIAMKQEGQYEQAAQSLTVALLMDACDPAPTVQIAECLIKMDMLVGAREALQTAIQQSYIDAKHTPLREYAQSMLDSI
ncbi:CesD/SycD/LcrH family type III secretion system chaperone [Chitinimonas arctica]|uniref:CesD/SycD/LcrH family type III secretion system chaperone n=1 Tax=Chitinimonas arctica TaxID=2594795 RepID=A0A516S9N0_9NEIS|nr:SycD/LcrH family type III secretion system chaperone [Chitinimonas arctica]QDQ24861.1 CesD/SycD/LcrH family type III secretion system chaperone [Chitinimonas arctica]